MAMTYAAVTGRIVVPGTDTGIPGELHATPLTSGGILAFPTEDYTTVGPAVAEVTADGTIEQEATPGLNIPTDVPEGTLWRLKFYPKGKGNLPVHLGDYEISTSADIADLVAVNPTVITPTLALQIANGVAALTGEDTAVAALVGDSGSDTAAALSATIAGQVDAVVEPVAKPTGFPTLAVLPMPTIRRLGGGKFKTDIDLSALRPAAGVTYYVGPGALGTGTSAADPAKIADAVAKPDVGTIVYLPGEYRRESSALAGTLTKSLNHIAAGPGVRITGWNANLAWTLESGNIYKATRSATNSVVDLTNLTSWGDFTVYEKKADLASITGPGQWALVGSTVYVWAIGNTDLTNATAANNQLRVAVTITGGIVAGSATRQYVKGIEFEGLVNGGLVASGGAVIMAEDCKVRYTSGLDSATISGTGSAMFMRRCEVSSGGGDGASYRGTGAEFIEIDCRIHHCGVYTGATNNNATTCHAGTRGIRIGGTYYTSGGPVVADVNDAKSWNLGCWAGRSELANSGSYATEAAGYDSDPATMWLDECEADDSDYAFRTYPGSLARIHTHGVRYRSRLGVLYPTDTGTVDFYDA